MSSPFCCRVCRNSTYEEKGVVDGINGGPRSYVYECTRCSATFFDPYKFSHKCWRCGTVLREFWGGVTGTIPAYVCHTCSNR